MEQLKVDTDDLPSLVKKKGATAAASMSSTEAFPTACPPVGDAHGGGQYPWPEGGRGVLELWLEWSAEGGGGQYPARGSGNQYLAVGGGGGHVGSCPTAGDPPHGIMCVGPI
jgi:hypothetical protein